MPTFAFSGRTRAGERVTGERAGDTIDAVAAALRHEQILITKLVPAASRASARPEPGPRRSRRRVPSKSLAVFTRQFSVMIDAGLPLVQCLDILGNQEPHRRFSQAILATRTDVENGASLADAMRRQPEVFDPLYTNMVAAGETGGILDVILKRLATYIEKNVKLKGQVRSAMVYPAAVLGIAALVVAVILWKVIPTFAALFTGLGAELPLPTRVVIAISENFIRLLPVLVIGGVALAAAVRRYYATERGRRVIDRGVLGMPVLGGIVRKIAVARFCRTLSTLLASGVPILDGLDITARTAGNAIVEDGVQSTRTSIERGDTIAAPLGETGVFPGMVVQMIAVGEATGALDAMLTKIADFYEEEVDQAVAGLLTLLEPVLIAILGIIVGGIVISMYMPIFGLIDRLAG